MNLQGVIEYSFSLFFAKLVSLTFLFWLPFYIENTSKFLRFSSLCCHLIKKRTKISEGNTDYQSYELEVKMEPLHCFFIPGFLSLGRCFHSESDGTSKLSIKKQYHMSFLFMQRILDNLPRYGPNFVYFKF